MDVTVVTPLQAATVAEAAIWFCTLLCLPEEGAEATDCRCRRKGIAFLPLVVESLEGWHTAAEAEVKKLGVVLARQTGQEEGEVLRHLWGRLGLLLQRGNAAILGNRLPTHPHPAVDGFHGFGNILALAEASIIEGLDHQRQPPGCSKDQGGINLNIFPCLTSSPYNDDDQVTLLLSEQDVNLVGDYLEGKENGVTKLLRVIIPIAF